MVFYVIREKGKWGHKKPDLPFDCLSWPILAVQNSFRALRVPLQECEPRLTFMANTQKYFCFIKGESGETIQTAVHFKVFVSILKLRQRTMDVTNLPPELPTAADGAGDRLMARLLPAPAATVCRAGIKHR